MHYLPLGGMVFLAAGILVFAVHVPSSQATTLLGSGLTGVGLGATVAPALFVAGFSLAPANLQRVFAIVELLRAVAAFMVAPIFVYFAANVGSSSEEGTQIALWIGFGLAILGAVVGVALYALGGARPQKPDLERFLAGESPAWYSPPLLAQVRRRRPPHRSRPKAPTDMAADLPGNRTLRTCPLRVRRLGARPTRDRASRASARAGP